ncbi:MAG: aminopeptidase P family protein [Clostridia bacterium]|nr:aminopeptidase P family protein [Clostridia bacterium]
MRPNNVRICERTAEVADALILLSPVNRRYVTSFLSSAGAVVVHNGKITYFTDFRYYESACIKQKQGIVDADIEIRLQDGKFMENLKEMLSDCKKILFEDGFVSFGTYNWYKNSFDFAELVPGGSGLMAGIRGIKTEEELQNIIKAQEITDKTFSFAVNYISDNIHRKDFTERELQLEMDYFMLKCGADGLAFDTIAISGKKSSLPHGAPENIPVSRGFLTMDFGAKFSGYCSDMTRTVCIGKPDEEMLKVYNTVLEAQKAAFEVIKAGIPGKEADKAARDVIENAGYAGTFGHSLGHSLGLEIHESPNFAMGVEAQIPENAVISVEPGIYLEGKYGVRIEDIVCLKENGFVDLTHSPKELIII